MPAFAPERWRILSPYLDKALEIPPEERPAWLEVLRKENPSLATDLQTLLKEQEALGKEEFLRTGAAARPAPAPLTGETVGAYTLETPIGQGGMGTVWLARRSDGRFEGHAAVKFLNVSFLGGAGEERFKREGSILARLSHPNIAHLIDAGVSAAGQPYLILEYVEGKNIDAYCNQHALEIEARIRLFLDVLAAVAHAHANLIVHRDIKPSNVLVADDGRVKLLDFGIAKLLEGETPEIAATVLTRQGERALTLAYASPEQVTGNTVTTGTDVYALGILLYLLLSGKHPAESMLHSPADLMKAIVDTQPARPSDAIDPANRLRRILRGDLDTIIAKALKKNPQERYPSVTALADDLRRYLKHEPISARPDRIAYRARKFVRRNQTAVALASAALIAMVAGVISTIVQARTVRTERDFALRHWSRAESINELNVFVLADAAPAGNQLSATDLLARAEQLVGRQQNADEVNRAELLTSIGSQYVALDEYGKGRKTLEEAHALSRRLSAPSTRARASCELAKALANQGDLPRAESLIQEGLHELTEEAQFALDRAICLRSGGEVAVRAGHSADAVARAKGAQLALSRSPVQPAGQELDNLSTLANILRNAGQVREASAAFEQASAHLTALGRDNTQRAIVLFNNWGLALAIWGRPLDAERVLRRTIELSQGNQAVTTVAANPLLNYARVLKELGKFDQAGEYADRAYESARAAGNKTVALNALFMRSAIYRSQGQLDRAGQLLTEVETGLARSLPPGHIAFPSMGMQRALIAQAQGEGQRALELANQAVAAVEASLKAGREGEDYLRSFLLSRSPIQLETGHPEEAAADARRVLKMFQDTTEPGTFTVNLGRAYFALGRALQAQGKREDARSAFRSATEHLQSALGSDHEETKAARQLAQSEA